MKRSGPSSRRISGLSLIEVLIALVVLGFGLLGLALLQTMNLRYTQSANQRTQAVNLASELIDTMRSNRSQLNAYNMNQDMTSVTPEGAGCATSATLNATQNVDRWKCEVWETLGPGTDVTVVANDATGVVTVTLDWDEANMPALVDGSRVQLQSQL